MKIRPRSIVITSIAIALLIVSFPANAALINLSLEPDVTITASYPSNPGYEPELAIDGDPLTRWETYADVYLKLDLGHLYYVDNIFLLSFSTGTPYAYRNHMYYWLYTSPNDVDWTAVVRAADLPDTSTMIPASNLVPIGDTIRYVRFGDISGDRWAHLNELEVWGESAPVPKPATILLLGTGLIGLAGFRRKFRK